MIGQTISHYKITEKLGQGGMGVVYKADDLDLKRTVALKFLPAHGLENEERKKRFLREAQAAAALNHPHICTIYEINQTTGVPFIVMECIDGESLKQKTGRRPLKLDEALDLAIQTAEGLQEAHEKGIVHRDIKGANIMVTQQGQVKITDFGLAHLSDATALTRDQAVLGTASYMSPEQIQGQRADRRSDIWAFGVVLYEMVAGRRPFEGEVDSAVQYAAVYHEHEPLTSLRSGLPLELDRIIDKALAKDPEERYQHVDDILTDLLLLHEKAGGTAQTRRTRPITRARSPKLRKRWPAAELGVAVVVAALGWGLSEYGGPLKIPWLSSFTLPEEKRIAVLPFQLVDEDASRRAFRDGLVEALTSKITRLEQFQQSLSVVPSSEIRAENVTSVRQAQRLFGVNLALTGSLQRVSDRMRLTLNLVDAATLRQVKSETVEASVGDLLRLQENAVERAVGLLELALEPDSARALAAGDTSQPRAYEQYLEGRGYLQRYDLDDNLDKAVESLESAVRQDPDYALAYAGLAEAYIWKYSRTKEKEWMDKALAHAKRSVELDQDLTIAHVKLGRVYGSTGQHEDAIAAFQQALKKYPSQSEAHRGLGRSYEKLGRVEQAEAAFVDAVKLRPNDWQTHSLLAIFYMRRGRYLEAEAAFRSAIELAPNNHINYRNLAVVYHMMGRAEDAKAQLETSVAIEPTAKAYSNLGTIYFYEERYQAAARVFELAIDLGAAEYQSWGNLADAYRWVPGADAQAKAAYRRAIELAEQALTVNPNATRVRSSLAVYWAKLSEPEKASAELSQLPASAKSDVNIRFKIAIVHELAGRRPVLELQRRSRDVCGRMLIGGPTGWLSCSEAGGSAGIIEAA